MRVAGLFVYPLKSARGVPLREARLDAFGIAHDRRWAVLGDAGAVLTQRDCPILATLSAQLTGDGLLLRARGGDSLHVARPADGPLESVGVWKDRTEGVSAGTEAAAWISGFVDRPARLVYMPDAVERPVDPRFGRARDRVGYADAFPLLLTSDASLDALNLRLDRPIPMNRFRPNLVVDGGEPFAEDGWTRLRVGEVILRLVKPCARCVVTTVDQETGIPGKEPLRTLAGFRKQDGKVLFGQNVVYDEPGTLRIGDDVEVLEPTGG